MREHIVHAPTSPTGVIATQERATCGAAVARDSVGAVAQNFQYVAAKENVDRGHATLLRPLRACSEDLRVFAPATTNQERFEAGAVTPERIRRRELEELSAKLRTATAAALEIRTTLARSLDDCRGGMERLLLLSAIDALEYRRAVVRARMMLNAWQRVAAGALGRSG